MLKAECPYIPPRFGTAEEADVLHASSEGVLERLRSSVARLLLAYPQLQRNLARQANMRHTSFGLFR